MSGTRTTLFSGGGGSFRAAKLDRLHHPNAVQRLLFTDTLYEDADTYRYLIEAAADVTGRRINWTVRAEDFPDYRVAEDVPIEEYAGNPEWRAFLADLRLRAMDAIPELAWIVEGRDPWEVFRDEHFVGNSRVDPCSKFLKRAHLDRWRTANCDPSSETFIVGLGDHEAWRFDGGKGKGKGLRARMAEQGWRYEAPLIELNERASKAIGRELKIAYAPLSEIGPRQPVLYDQNYKHGNCGGMCVKAGHAHWQNRFRVQPDRFAYDAMMERKCRVYLGTDDACMLNDRRGGGPKRPMSLDAFAARMRASPEIAYEYAPGSSGCGCAL